MIEFIAAVANILFLKVIVVYTWEAVGIRDLACKVSTFG